MLSDHNLGIPEGDYRDLDLPSYSMLASIAKEGVDVVNGVKNASFVLKFGSLVDDLCFMPNVVKDKYHEGKAKKAPTGNVKKIIDAVAEELKSKGTRNPFVKPKVPNTSMIKHKDLFLAEAKKQGVYKAYSDEKTMESLSKGKTYFKDKLESEGKIPISSEMWEHAQITANTLQTHPFTSRYFAVQQGVELFYQYMFINKVNGRDVKGMLDCVVCDHNTKTIYPVDLKTGELSVQHFPDVMLQYKYYIQAALYRKALINIVNNDPDLAGYHVAQFEFVYISKVNPYKPMIYVVPKELYESALLGFTDVHGYKHKGVYDLLGEYYNCKDHGHCAYTEEESIESGRVMLDNILKK